VSFSARLSLRGRSAVVTGGTKGAGTRGGRHKYIARR
jgi:hypothetical protein